MGTRRVVAGLLLAGLWPPAAEAQFWGGGRMRQTERAVLEYRAGALTTAEAEAFLGLLDRGVADVESLVAPGLPAAARRNGRIRFVVSARIGMSRTYGRTVVLPLERVRRRSAPYLHETVHALVPSRGDRPWLSEGLASYLESWVSENRGGYDAHVFTRAGDRGIHAAARRYLASDQGRGVLPWVGSRGQPPRLEDDRSGVARPFYVLSHSLTKYLVDGSELETVVRVLVSGEDEGLARATGRSEEQWKRQWLLDIGAYARASAGGI